MLQTKVLEKIKTHLKFNNFFPENRAVNKIMWKNMVEPDRPQMTVWRMRTACWIPQTTTTLREFVILIAFPVQQWLHEHALLLHCTSIACIVYFYFVCFWGYFLLKSLQKIVSFQVNNL
jgi:hypothetical protein